MKRTNGFEQTFGLALAVVGLWIITVGTIAGELFIRLMFMPTGVMLFALGIYGWATFRMLDKHERQARAEAKEQKRIDKEFKRIQKRSKRQFKNIG